MDGKFACIRRNLLELQINLNICSNNEHVGEIELLNRTVQERAIGINNTIPFKKMPGRIIVELITLVIF